MSKRVKNFFPPNYNNYRFGKLYYSNMVIAKGIRGFVLMAILWAAFLTSSAQSQRVQNKPYIDLRRFHYGFTIGIHDQGIGLRNNGYIDPESGAQWFAENDQHNWGFHVGVLGEWKISNHLALRIIPSMYFGSKGISFLNKTNGEYDYQEMKSAYIAVPVDLKFSAPRFNNYRPYVMAGVIPMYDLANKKQDNLRTKPASLGIEVGLGCDTYLPFFKFIPELKFCFGLGDILDRNRRDLTDKTKTVFTQSIDRATSNMVVLSFYFE